MTHTPGNRKPGAVEARLTVEQKETIGRAATLLGLSLSDFIAVSAIQPAKTVIHEHNMLNLTAQDSLAFVEAILNPRMPNAALRAAFAQHDRQVVSGD